MHMIIDTDCGVDDAQAIMLALAYPGVTVDAITTLTGNVHIDHVVPNVLTTIQAMGQTIPVYCGVDRPLVEDWEDATEFHGSDGLGDYHDRPPLIQQVESEHAVHALIRMVNESPGEYTLVALGPLTNIALAIRLDSSFASKIKQFVFMGGTIHAMGNTPTVTAEYNIYTDPEAAYITLKAFEHSTMLSWETTIEHGFTWEQFQALADIDTQAGRFFRRISLLTAERLKSTFHRPAYLLPDPLAMAVALEPGIVQAGQEKYMTVELNGRFTRAQTVIDYLGRTGNKPNVAIINKLDVNRVFELFQQALS